MAWHPPSPQDVANDLSNAAGQGAGAVDQGVNDVVDTTTQVVDAIVDVGTDASDQAGGAGIEIVTLIQQITDTAGGLIQQFSADTKEEFRRGMGAIEEGCDRITAAFRGIEYIHQDEPGLGERAAWAGRSAEIVAVGVIIVFGICMGAVPFGAAGPSAWGCTRRDLEFLRSASLPVLTLALHRLRIAIRHAAPGAPQPAAGDFYRTEILPQLYLLAAQLRQVHRLSPTSPARLAAAAEHFRRLHMAVGKLVFAAERRRGGDPRIMAALLRFQSHLLVATATLVEARNAVERLRLRQNMQLAAGLRGPVGGGR